MCRESTTFFWGETVIKITCSKLFVSLATLTLLAGACADGEKQLESDAALAAKAAAEAQAAAEAEIRTLSLEAIHFSYDDAAINPASQEILIKVARALRQGKQVYLTIQGHADERGSTEYNLALGEKRAASVKNYLVNLGADASGLSTVSFGEERPAVEAHNEDAYSKNRRAAFEISSSASK